MAGYCSVADVCSGYPTFTRNQPNSPSDVEIQAWIDQYKAEIRAALLARGFDPEGNTLGPDQSNFLRLLNRMAAAAELGDVIHASITLQPVGYPEAVQSRNTYERILNEIGEGLHDTLFQDIPSTTTGGGISGPRFGGIAGGETERRDTRQDQNRAFSRNQVF